MKIKYKGKVTKLTIKLKGKFEIIILFLGLVLVLFTISYNLG